MMPLPATRPWGDLSIATLRRGLLTHGGPCPDAAAGDGCPRLLAVLDDGTFVVADAVRTVRALAAVAG